MKLKQLEINGFKSFGKKVVLDFKTSITGIVGPNGSGKSNVAEAFRFVLGEQSTKNMRGKKGEDLIFAGSVNLGKMNKASVKIILDNSEFIRSKKTEFSQEKSFVTEQLAELARAMGLKEKDFLACLDNKATMASIQQEYQTGVKAGVLGESGTTGGTPHTIIITRMGKNYVINGAQPYSVIKSIIDIILQGQ